MPGTRRDPAGPLGFQRSLSEVWLIAGAAGVRGVMARQGGGGDSARHRLLLPRLFQAEASCLAAKRAIKPGSFMYFYLFKQLPGSKRSRRLLPVVCAQVVTLLRVLGTEGAGRGSSRLRGEMWRAGKFLLGGAGGRCLLCE